jgi:phage tail-like protein
VAEEYIFQLRITGPDNLSRMFVVPLGITRIGRQAGNDLVLESNLISRQHATLECTPTGCQIMDMGSANGTRVNGEQIPPNVPVLLAHGALVDIGTFRIAFEQIRVAAAQPAPEPPPPPVVEVPLAEPAPIIAPAGEPEPAKPARGKGESGEGSPPRDLTPPPPVEAPKPDYSQLPPGMDIHSNRLLSYLPGIYHNDFMARFLGIFEAIITPIEWNIDNFDLYLDPGTAPDDYLPWLANWFTVSFDPSWDEEQRRQLLQEAHAIYARRGTRWALCRVLEIYTRATPEIIDLASDLDPFVFRVRLPINEGEGDRVLIERLIDANKPAHTDYKLEFIGRKKESARKNGKNGNE